MNKLKLFLENFLVYGFGGSISKLIPLIMIPIIIRIMPNTEYYGISDMSNTVVQFGSAFALMGMYDAMYRMFFEKNEDDYKKAVCSTALLFTLFSSFLIFVIMVALRNVIANYFFSDSKYSYIVYLSAMATLVSATNSIVSAPTRMQNNRKTYIIANTVGPLISYGLAIPLLLAGHYTIALPLATVISGITMELVFWLLNRTWFRIRLFDKKLLKQLLILAVPLLPNFLIYWVFNSCDKVMITNLVGIGAAGVYSVGSKLGHASQLIYTAFAGGWQFFAFSTMKDENQVETNSRIYEYLGVISFIATALVCCLSFPLFKVLFPEEYLEGYIVAPYLFMAPLLQMLYQTGNNQFLIIKKSWPGMFILSTGAIVNVILNWVSIPIMGIEGAAIGTLAGYVVTDIVDIIALKKCKLMTPRVRFLWIVILMMSYMIIWRLLFSKNTVGGFILWIGFVILCIYVYKDDLSKLCNIIRSSKKERKA